MQPLLKRQNPLGCCSHHLQFSVDIVSLLSLLLFPVWCRYVQDYDPADPRTHKGHDLNRMTMGELYKTFNLNEVSE